MFGYHGRYLRIDVSNGSATWVPLSEAVPRRFLGGVGLAASEPVAPAGPR
jgi:aldehyde:ferredoxin oxidoreductase